MASISGFTQRDSGIQQNQLKIIAKKRNFSNEEVHSPGEEMLDYTDYVYLIRKTDISSANVKVYANGISDDNNGYVSLMVYYPYNISFEVTCLVSVIDESENQNFSRTFSFFSKYDTTLEQKYLGYRLRFDIDKYIKRETLLSEANVYLPKDVLTLLIDVRISHPDRSALVIRMHDRLTILNSFTREGSFDSRQHYLRLDSEVAKRLSEESNYFRRILESPFTEQKERRMKIPKEEFDNFHEVIKIVVDFRDFGYASVNSIFEIYAVADKYDIQTVKETCLCFLKLCLADHDAAEILEAADEYSLLGLKKIIQNFIESNVCETVAVDGGFKLNQLSVGCEWIYKRILNRRSSYLTFRKLKINFDFYH